MTNPDDISIAEARKLALVAQQLPTSNFSRGRRGVSEAIAHLGYVQIDTISVVERAHHLTLWNRVPRYRRHFLDQLVRDRSTKAHAPDEAARIVNGLRQRKVLISRSGPGGNTLKIRPPLPFSKGNAELLLERMDDALTEVESSDS